VGKPSVCQKNPIPIISRFYRTSSQARRTD